MCFWNKVQYPDLLLEDLQIGNTFEIFSRKYTLVGYGDDKTQQLFQPTQGKAFLLIKPDAYQHIGKIIDTVLNEGLEITRLKMTRMDTNLSRYFAQNCGGGDPKSFKTTMEFLSQDVSVGLEISGNEAIGIVNTLWGPPNPKKAKEVAPGSFSALYGSDALKNAVYCTSDEDPTDANKFFSAGFSEVLDNCTWWIIKPHWFAERTVGQIIDLILAQEFEISAMAMFNLKANDIKEFFEYSWSKYPEFKQMMAHMCEGPWIVMELRGDSVVANFAEVAGDTDPEEARASQPRSIRAQFGSDIARNAIYCSNAKDEGIMECEYFFRLLED